MNKSGILIVIFLSCFVSIISSCNKRNAWENNSLFNDFSFSPNGEFLIIANHDGRINVIDIHKKEYIKSLKHRESYYPIADVCFLPSGKQFISCGRDSYLYIWNIDGFENINEILDKNEIPNDIDISDDGTFLAIGGKKSSANINNEEGGITLWNIKEMEFVGELVDNKCKSVNIIKFSPDNKLIASESKEGSVILWNLKDKKLYKHLEGEGKWCLFSGISFSPDMKYIAFGGEPVALYTMSSEKNRNEIKYLPVKPPVCFSGDGKYLAAIERNSSNEIVFIDTVNWKKIFKFDNAGGSIKSLKFNNSGNIIAGITDSELWLWDINTKKPIVMFDENFRRKVFDK